MGKTLEFNIRILFGFSLIFLQTTPAEAQPGTKPGKTESAHFYMKDGLPDENVTGIVQDKLGFLWLSTRSGFARFDGYKFTIFENNPSSRNSLSNNGINSLFLDKKERLWISHEEGLDVFDLVTEKFLLHWYDSANRRNGLNIRVTQIRERKDGMLWICTAHGVFVGDPTTLQIRKRADLPADLVYKDILETANGSIWAATQTKLLHLDPKTLKLTSYQTDPLDEKSLSHNAVKTIHEDKERRLWIGTVRGLNQFIPEDRSFKRYFPQLAIVSLFEDDNGKFLIGSEYGVGDFDRETGAVTRVTDSYYTWKIIKDQQGIIWLATLHGLHQINPEIKKFNIYSQFDINIGHLVEDENHDIWMSTFRGLYRFDHNFKNIYQHSKVGPGLSNLVSSLYTDSRGSLWIGSDKKIEKFDLKNHTSDSILLDMNKMSMLVDANGKIWIGGHDKLGVYDPATGQYNDLEAAPSAGVHVLVEDVQHNIWAGTSAGLLRYNIKTNKLDIFTNDPDDKESLSNNTVYHIMIDTQGTIWVATDGGLNKIMPGTEHSNPRFRHWRKSNSGIPNNNVYTILAGRDGSLWLACGNMICQFYPDRNAFKNYDHYDGLPGYDIKEAWYHGRGLISSIGQLYFGTGWGVVVFHPDSIQQNNFIPPISLTSFYIHNQPVPVNHSNADTLGWKSPLSRAISYSEEIVLNYDQNDFALEFSALNYINAENNRYKYKLEPYENEWVHAKDRRATYTNITPGTYTFRVIGSNNDDTWNYEGATLSLVITPPWWKTWWAYSLYALTCITLLLAWRQYDIKRVKLKHRAEHLSELDQLKSRFFANISHEFRTPITLILGPLKKLYHNATKKDEKEELGIMVRNGERLHGLINQLLDLSKIEAGKMKLHAMPTEIVEFLKEIASSYESMATDKKIKYIFYPEVQELRVYIDQEKISKVVHNLLSNAFKFTKPGGEIILNLKKEGEYCLITLRDSGIGIPFDQIDKIFDRFYQVDSSQTRIYEGSGLGMALAKELIDLHKGKISVNSTEGKGSIFTVHLLLGKEHLDRDEINNEEYSLSERTHISDIAIPADTGEITTETPAPLSKPTILIIEDNQDMRTYVRKILLEQYQVLEAPNGKAGVKLAEENIPELIISDIMMPEMDGYKVCSLVKNNELTSHIPVILLTAKADRESKLTGLETGADDYLSKPFDAEELILIVRNRIEERRKMRDRFSRQIMLEPKQITVTSLDEKFLTKVLGIIEGHMDDEYFSIDELSRQAGYSNMHFYRKIKALSGQTPSLFLRMIRLKRAADLLSRNSDNVAQVAYAVGFSSLSYFNKCFKEQFGVTPGQFAKRSSKPV